MSATTGQLTLTAEAAQPEKEVTPDLSEVGAALEEMRVHLGYKTWQDAWSAFVGGYRQDGDPRIVRGAANLVMLVALLADDPLADGSLLCCLAEVGAAFVSEDLLSELAEQEGKRR